MFNGMPENTNLISFDYSDLNNLQKIETTKIGFNVFALKKTFEISSLGLNIVSYNSKSIELELEKAGFKINKWIN